jgi:hypothetical protein
MGNNLYLQNHAGKVKYGGFSKEDIEQYKTFFSKKLSNLDGTLNKKLLMNYLKLQST